MVKKGIAGGSTDEIAPHSAVQTSGASSSSQLQATLAASKITHIGVLPEEDFNLSFE